MAEFIGAYDEKDGVVFEMAVRGVTEQGAKTRGVVSLLGRRPAEITAIEDIRVMGFSSGGLVEYRVMIKLKHGENLRDKLKITDAVNALEDLL